MHPSNANGLCKLDFLNNSHGGFLMYSSASHMLHSSLILKNRFSDHSAHFNSFFILSLSLLDSFNTAFIYQNSERRVIGLKMRCQSSRFPSRWVSDHRQSSTLSPHSSICIVATAPCCLILSIHCGQGVLLLLFFFKASPVTNGWESSY